MHVPSGGKRRLTLLLQDFGGALLQHGQVGQDGHHLVLGVGRVYSLAVPAGLQQDLDGVELQQDLAGHAVEEGDVGQGGRRQQEDLATGGALAQVCGVQSAKGPIYSPFYKTKKGQNLYFSYFFSFLRFTIEMFMEGFVGLPEWQVSVTARHGLHCKVEFQTCGTD